MENENRRKSEINLKLDSVSTKLKVVTFLKWSFLFACTGGFLYQIIQFLLQYYSYPMVVNLDIQRPDKFIEPSTTFCYSNLVRRSLFCEKNKNKCEQPEDMKSFCDKHPHYCNTDVNLTDFKIPKLDVYLHPENLTQAELDEFGSEQMDVNIHWLSDYPKPAIIERGYWTSKKALRSCQIVHSRIFSERKAIVRRFPLPRMRHPTLFQKFVVTVEEDELFDPRDTPEIVFSLQSPYESHDPYIDGVRLKTGKSYEIHIKLEEEHLLEDPFATSCLDYMKLWEKDKSKPRSSMGCVDQCLDILTRPCNNCSMSVPTDEYGICKGHVQNFCDRTEQGELKVQYRACLRTCKLECRKLIYKFKAQEVPDKKERSNPLGRKQETRIELVIDEPEVRAFIHKAKYHEVELFSYIGGFMGCWLGISIWSIFYALLQMKEQLKLKEKLQNRLSLRGSLRSFKNKSKEEHKDEETGKGDAKF